VYSTVLSIRNGYRRHIVEYSSFINDEKRDVHLMLWKSCFYKQIEDFRKSIRKYASYIEEKKTNQGFAITDQSINQEKLKSHVSKLTSSFILFLTDSINFYLSLMKEVSLKLNFFMYLFFITFLIALMNK
jgi:hypothetical protein